MGRPSASASASASVFASHPSAVSVDVAISAEPAAAAAAWTVQLRVTFSYLPALQLVSAAAQLVHASAADVLPADLATRVLVCLFPGDCGRALPRNAVAAEYRAVAGSRVLAVPPSALVVAALPPGTVAPFPAALPARPFAWAQALAGLAPCASAGAAPLVALAPLVTVDSWLAALAARVAALVGVRAASSAAGAVASLPPAVLAELDDAAATAAGELAALAAAVAATAAAVPRDANSADAAAVAAALLAQAGGGRAATVPALASVASWDEHAAGSGKTAGLERFFSQTVAPVVAAVAGCAGGSAAPAPRATGASTGAAPSAVLSFPGNASLELPIVEDSGAQGARDAGEEGEEDGEVATPAAAAPASADDAAPVATTATASIRTAVLTDWRWFGAHYFRAVLTVGREAVQALVRVPASFPALPPAVRLVRLADPADATVRLVHAPKTPAAVAYALDVAERDLTLRAATWGAAAVGAALRRLQAAVPLALAWGAVQAAGVAPVRVSGGRARVP
jgi:hypothetical protein